MNGCLHLLRFVCSNTTVSFEIEKDAIVKLKEKLSQSSHVSPKPPFPRAKAPPLRGTGDSGDESFLAPVPGSEGTLALGLYSEFCSHSSIDSLRFTIN